MLSVAATAAKKTFNETSFIIIYSGDAQIAEGNVATKKRRAHSDDQRRKKRRRDAAFSAQRRRERRWRGAHRAAAARMSPVTGDTTRTDGAAPSRCVTPINAH